MQHSSLFLSDSKDIEFVYGNSASIFVDLSEKICPQVLSKSYQFEDPEIFEERSKNGQYKIKDINEVYWREILFRAHICAVSSLIRNCRLMDATVREFGVCNIHAWASCARALLENIGDSNDVLYHIPNTIAENFSCISRCVAGQENNTIHTAKEFEDKLIEFMYAHKPERAQIEQLPNSFIAKSTWEYIEVLKKSKIGDISRLYKVLCELSHPAATSVHYMFSSRDNGRSFSISSTNDTDLMIQIVNDYRSIFDGLMMVALNPIFISLRVLQEFTIIPHTQVLKEVNFDNIPLWSKIKTNMNLVQQI